MCYSYTDKTVKRKKVDWKEIVRIHKYGKEFSKWCSDHDYDEDNKHAFMFIKHKFGLRCSYLYNRRPKWSKCSLVDIAKTPWLSEED